MRSILERSSLRRWLLAAGLGLALGGGAWAAVEQGTLLYVKAKNTRLMAAGSFDAAATEVLQPGAKVSYVAADKKDKRWHRVKVDADGKEGFVFQSNLSRTPPLREELGEGGDTEDLKAFASKGAATKAVTEGALAYGQKLPDKGETARRLLALEALSKQISNDQVAERARKTGLPQVVGKDEKVASRSEVAP